MVENEQLRQELRRCEVELQELRAQPVAPCEGCEHSQVGQAGGSLRPGPVDSAAWGDPVPTWLP